MNDETTKVSSTLSSPFGGTGGFDYIIAGAGCAGLSLVMHMIRSGSFSDKQILLIDKDAKKANDRTWCFWEKEDGLFQPIVYKQWGRLHFYSNTFSDELNIAPYQYKMIRGVDFYDYCLQEIARHSNIQFLQAPVQHIFSSEKSTGVMVDGKMLHSTYVFNSIVFDQPQLSKKEYWLLQHFKGWTIETHHPCFEESKATLMDFRIDQNKGTAFCYVLPFSPTKALVEYTLFTQALLPQEAYDAGLKHYIENVLSIKDYKIAEEEFGVIPMTNFEFEAHQNNIINMGTAGGHTKGSSGYTFQFIQKASAGIVRNILQKGCPQRGAKGPRRFHFYDSILLHILYNSTLEGSKIFTDLFQKNKPQQVLKFLDNETTLREELSIISTLPTLPFLKAAIKHLI